MALPTNGELLKLAGRFASDQALADHLKVARTTLRDHINRTGARKAIMEARGALRSERTRAQRAGLKLDGNHGVLTTRPSATLKTPEEALRERGLEPSEWTVRNMVVNEWEALGSDSEIHTMRQLKLYLAKRMPNHWLFPAVETAYIAPRAYRKSGGSELIVVCGDQQAPYQDAKFHELFRQWLARNRPHRGVLLGDTLDFPTISRHADNPEWHVSPQECINAGYLILRDYVRASEGTRWQKLVGNHDERIRSELLARSERLYGIRPADVPGEVPAEDAMSLRRLLHLDALGIEFVKPRGKYTHAQVNLSPRLVVRHGWLTGANSGLASLKQASYSILVGHTHRQSLAYRTVYASDGAASLLQAAEVGCMCRLDGGLGYAVDPDWMNGFATVSMWPDGRFSIDLAKYADGILYWRKQRFA